MLRFDLKLCGYAFLVSLMCIAGVMFVKVAYAGSKGDRAPDYRLNMRSMTMLLSLIEKDSPVAIVTFETDTFEGQKIVKGEFSKDKAQIAATGIHVVYSGQTVVRHVQGTFRLEKALNGKSPELGHIEQRVTLKVGPVGNLHRDDSY